MRLTCLFFLLPVFLWSQHAEVFPQPSAIKITNNSLSIAGTILVEETAETKLAVSALHELFESECSVHLKLVPTKSAQLVVDNTYGLGNSGAYSLIVDTKYIRLEYHDYEGLINAFTSLSQWIKDPAYIRGVELTDNPRFLYRGTHLDCSRHFFTVPELEQFIDRLALLKINRFHWHLTDDQGWRLEIKAFPELTTVGAWRDSTVIGHFSATPRTYEKKTYGGFYTQEDAKHIVAYCAARGIEVIPEIEMPGHARAALAAYPELGCTGYLLPVEGLWGVFDDVFCSKLETRDFLKKVLEEVIEIFPSKTIHVGGDEVPKARWNVCQACQLTMKQHGLMDVHQLQSFFIQDMEAFLNSKGRTLMGWDEILEGGLAANAQVMSWRGVEGGIEAAKTGHPVVMTPTAYCYLDYYQSGLPGEPLAIGGFLPLEKVLNFNPLAGLDQQYHKYVLGAQGNLWTEYLPTMSAVEYQAFPRLIALSEVMWTAPENRVPYGDFVRALLNFQLPRLQAAGIQYSTACFEPQVTFEPVKGGLSISAISPLDGVTTSFDVESPKIDSSKKNTVLENGQLLILATKSKHELMVMANAKIHDSIVKQVPLKLTTHLLVGKELRFTKAPSPKYNVHGNLGLTDGVCGQLPWKGNQWLGFEEDTVQFQIDFGKKTEVRHMELQTLDDSGSWIHSPERYVFEVSSNGKNWKVIAANSLTNSKIEVNQKMKARYFRMTLINAEKIPLGMPGAGFTPWTFVDEWMFTN